MALTAEVKDELSRIEVTKTCCRKTEVATMLRIAGSLQLVSGQVLVEAEFDSGAIARRIRNDVKSLYGHEVTFAVVQPSGLRRSAKYAIRITEGGAWLARQTGLVDGRGRPVRGLPPAVVAGGPCDAESAWRAAFLAHGSLTEPGRSSALEITCPSPETALALVGSARRLGIVAKAREVRGVDRRTPRTAESGYSPCHSGLDSKVSS